MKKIVLAATLLVSLTFGSVYAQDVTPKENTEKKACCKSDKKTDDKACCKSDEKKDKKSCCKADKEKCTKEKSKETK